MAIPANLPDAPRRSVRDRFQRRRAQPLPDATPPAEDVSQVTARLLREKYSRATALEAAQTAQGAFKTASRLRWVVGATVALVAVALGAAQVTRRAARTA